MLPPQYSANVSARGQRSIHIMSTDAADSTPVMLGTQSIWMEQSATSMGLVVLVPCAKGHAFAHLVDRISLPFCVRESTLEEPIGVRTTRQREDLPYRW